MAADQQETVTIVLDTGRRLDAKISNSHSTSEIDFSNQCDSSVETSRRRLTSFWQSICINFPIRLQVNIYYQSPFNDPVHTPQTLAGAAAD
jgi:hypothetical protein